MTRAAHPVIFYVMLGHMFRELSFWSWGLDTLCSYRREVMVRGRPHDTLARPGKSRVHWVRGTRGPPSTTLAPTIVPNHGTSTQWKCSWTWLE